MRAFATSVSTERVVAVAQPSAAQALRDRAASRRENGDATRDTGAGGPRKAPDGGRWAGESFVVVIGVPRIGSWVKQVKNKTARVTQRSPEPSRRLIQERPLGLAPLG